MAKRLTDTGKWSKKWFRGLPAAYKLFWLYLCDVCDHAGTWEVDMETARLQAGGDIDEEKALELFGHRVRVIDDGHRWWIVGFVKFHYANAKGEVSTGNKMYAAVLKTFEKYGLSVDNKGDGIPHQSPIDGGIYKYKDKNIVSTIGSDIETIVLNKKEDIAPSMGDGMGHQSPIDGGLMGDAKITIKTGSEVLKLNDCIDAFMSSAVCASARDLILKRLHELSTKELLNAGAEKLLREWCVRFNETLAAKLMTTRSIGEWTNHLHNWICKQDLSVNPKLIHNGKSNGTKNRSAITDGNIIGNGKGFWHS